MKQLSVKKIENSEKSTVLTMINKNTKPSESKKMFLNRSQSLTLSTD